MKNIFSMLAVVALLSGCVSSLFEKSSTLTVQIDAEPAGTAEYYMDGVRFTERVRHIELSEEERYIGTYTIDLPEVRWPSGAVVPQARQTLSLEKMSHRITIRHPSLDSVEGRFDRASKHELTVRYESNPAGAQFILSGVEELTSPTKSIPLTLEDFKRGYVVLPSVEARWSSGTNARIESTQMELEGANQISRTVILNHPAPLEASGLFDRLPSHEIVVRYFSEPSRALLFSDYEHLGRTPTQQTIQYSFSDYEKGYVMLDPVQARWTSGAQTNSGPIKLDLTRSVHEHTFLRPEYPNLNVDVEFINSENDAAFREKEEERSRELLEAHYRELEKIERDKVELEEKRFKLLQEKQAAEIARDKELLRLYKLEIENSLKAKRPETPALPPK